MRRILATLAIFLGFIAAPAEADAKARLDTLGVEPVGSIPAEFAAVIEREIPRMAGVLPRAGIRPE